MTEKPAADKLIAASPGPLRDALVALLLSLPQVRLVRTENAPAKIVQIAAENPSMLVIVVQEAGTAWMELPGKIRAAAPGCRLIVLANGEGEITGADRVLQQGARPETLVAAVLSLLNV